MKSKYDISKLKDEDIYSMAMFMIYKLTDVPEYSIVGELPYILDKKGLLDLCTYFGGRTIKIPTVEQMDSIVHVILLYQKVDIEGNDFDTVYEELGYKNCDNCNLKTVYARLKQVLSSYNFRRSNVKSDNK